MKKHLEPIVFTALVFLLSSCADQCYLESKDGLDLLHLKGSPYERGLAHGRLLREEIGQSVASWQNEVEEQFDTDLNAVLEQFYTVSSFKESLEIHDPDLLEEVKGLAAGSGFPFPVLLAFQMSEELSTILSATSQKCTTVGFFGADSATTMLAQNMDPPLFLHGHPLLMHLTPEDGKPEQFIFTVPGLLGLAGMNDCGVAITCMGMSMLNHKTDGLPVVSVVRQTLDCKNLEDANTLFNEFSFGIPQCYSIGSPDGLRCFECSAGGIAEFYPFEDKGLVLHTNHSINNRDFNPEFVELLAEYGRTVDDPYFCPRYFRAYDEIEERDRILDVQDAEAILRLEEPEQEPILNPYTLGTLVMKLNDEPTLFLALGQNPDAPFYQFDFQEK